MNKKTYILSQYEHWRNMRSSLYCFQIKRGCFCIVSETKAGKKRHKTVLAKQFVWLTNPPNKKKAIDSYHSYLYITYKVPALCTGQQNLFVKMKRTKRGKETGMRHSKAAQTQHWTQDYDYSPGDPNTDTRTVWARLQSHAGGAVICFSRRFKLQLTADLFIPASLNISIISQKTRYLQRC